MLIFLPSSNPENCSWIVTCLTWWCEQYSDSRQQSEHISCMLFLFDWWDLHNYIWLRCYRMTLKVSIPSVFSATVEASAEADPRAAGWPGHHATWGTPPIIYRIEKHKITQNGCNNFNINVACCSSEEPSRIPRADSEFGEGQGKTPRLKNKSYKF